MTRATTGRLDGKVAVVTGGGRGIGLQVARAFVRQGARVVIADLGSELDGAGSDAAVAETAAAEIRAEGGECLGLFADVTDAESASAALDTAMTAFGRADVLVNAAGVMRPGSILEIEPADLETALRVHLAGTLQMTRAAVALWAGQPGRGRRVLNISSDSGLFGDEDYLAYGAAKAGVVGLTLGCAGPLGELGATANVFIPQAATRMTAAIPLEALPDRERWETGEFDPAHVAPALVYLASDESEWLTGQIIGGWGYEIHLYDKPRRARSLYSPGPWDVDDLFRRFREALEPAIRTDNP